MSNKRAFLGPNHQKFMKYDGATIKNLVKMMVAPSEIYEI
jgi:hypothetical protein